MYSVRQGGQCFNSHSKLQMSEDDSNISVKAGDRKVQKQAVTDTETYLLKWVIRSANDFSQAYIFIILMPVITSFMVLILVSVKVAVLLLRGHT